MVKTKIAVLVSGGGTNLQALLDAQREGVLTDGEIVLVISSNDSAYALTRAAQDGAPLWCAAERHWEAKRLLKRPFPRHCPTTAWNCLSWRAL